MLVLLVGGGLGGYLATQTYFRPSVLELGDSFSDYELVDTSQNPELERYAAIWHADAGEQPSASGTYRMNRGDHPYLVRLSAHPGFVWNPQKRIDEGFNSWKPEIAFTESAEMKRDRRDQFLRCAVGKHGDQTVPVIFCAWAGQGGHLVGVFGDIDLATALVGFQEIIDTVVKKV